jgi:hypothetical protein
MNKMRSKREFSKDAISSTKLCTVLAQVFNIQNLGINGSNYWFIMCLLMTILYIIQFLISIYLWSLLE